MHCTSNLKEKKRSSQRHLRASGHGLVCLVACLFQRMVAHWEHHVSSSVDFEFRQALLSSPSPLLPASQPYRWYSSSTDYKLSIKVGMTRPKHDEATNQPTKYNQTGLHDRLPRPPSAIHAMPCYLCYQTHGPLPCSRWLLLLHLFEF